jgi:hypothetical protein
VKKRSVIFIIFGLGVGAFLFLKNPNPENLTNIIENKIDADSSNEVNEKENTTLPFSNTKIAKQPTNDANSKKVSSPKVLEPQVKNKVLTDIKDSFNPKKEVRYNVVEGYAIAAEDIILGKPKDPTQTTGQTTLTSDEIQIWPSTEIQYAFDSNLSDNSKQTVLAALNQFAKKTSFVFTPYTGYEKDFLVFSASDKLCASYVGRIGGAQPILVHPSCRESEITHELMHAIGFIHEHQRDLRDSFLTIQFNNIQKDKLINFDILPQAYQKNYKNSSDLIDFKSLMIYSSNAFVISPGLYSILIKRSESKISENTSLSDLDLEKIDNLYFRKF